MKEKEIKKRKAYNTAEQQSAANKRYMQSEEAKVKRRRRTDKSATKRFILNSATFEELEDIKKYIEERFEILSK